jgi:7,8-dihydropterin-6-yl-methyl-4-(beta-D-ribofuranosyl)aminobenzene 5'-phosphate synthase
VGLGSDQPRDGPREVNLTILVDNQATDGLVSEHGLSFWIEAGGKRLLLDTGQGAGLEHNAPALGVDLGLADLIVISHGHYDHTGGLPYALGRAQSAAICCHRSVLQPRYAVREGKARAIGIPAPSLAALNSRRDSVRWVEGSVWLSDEIGLTGPIPRLTAYEDTGGPFFLDPEGTRPDLLDDDLALFVRTEKGLVVFLGCAHAGVVNTLRYVREVTGEQRIHAIVGGFHLMDADQARLDNTVGALLQVGAERVVPTHCTGKNTLALLERALREQMTPGYAGLRLRF